MPRPGRKLVVTNDQHQAPLEYATVVAGRGAFCFTYFVCHRRVICDAYSLCLL